MLVLRRKVGETIVLVGPDGTVSRFMIMDVRPGGSVGLSFDIDPRTTVDRLEVYESKQHALKEQRYADTEEKNHEVNPYSIPLEPDWDWDSPT